MSGELIWYGIVHTGQDKSPPRAHAYLLTEKGLSERPLCGIGYERMAAQPTLGLCRRCYDISNLKGRDYGKRRN